LNKRKIILDCDPGHDDAVAILLMLASPNEIDCLGITVCAGNVSLDLTTNNTLKILSLANNNKTKVFKGCSRPLVRPLVTAEHVHGDTGLDTGSGKLLPMPNTRAEEKHAVNFILETLKNNPRNEVTLVATGPLTNLAAALAMDPEIFLKAKEIIIMGGAGFEPGNVTPAAEFNIYVDPFAAEAIFNCGLDLTMFGLDVTHQMIITKERLSNIINSSNKIGKHVGDFLTFFNSYDSKKYGWDGAPLHDPCTIAWLIDPSIFEGRKMAVSIETNNGPAYGRTIADWFDTTSDVKNAFVITHGDPNKFFSLINNRFKNFDE